MREMWGGGSSGVEGGGSGGSSGGGSGQDVKDRFIRESLMPLLLRRQRSASCTATDAHARVFSGREAATAPRPPYYYCECRVHPSVTYAADIGN